MTTAPTRISRDEGWGRSSRFYRTADGLDLPSVTTILEAAPAKPALIGWASKTERELVLRCAADLYEDLPAATRMQRVAYLNTLTQRLGKTKAADRELQKAKAFGLQAHQKIEWTLHTELKQAVGPEPAIADKALWAFMAWEDWRKQANLVPIAVEDTVWSVRHGYAGTMDLLCELDLPIGGRGRVVVDWKTSKGIWPEMALQNAAYVEALREMGHVGHDAWGLIVRLPKIETDPEFEVRWYSPRQRAGDFPAFLACLEVWKWQEAQRDPKANG